MRKSQEKGFTLIELLVVIIVIGILAAVAVPIYLNQQRKAEDANLTTDIKNAGMAVTTGFANYADWDGIVRAGGGINTNTLYIDNNSGARTIPTNAIYWNRSGNLPAITAGDGVYLEIVHLKNAVPASGWDRGHETGEFCIVGVDLRSSYDWTQDDGRTAYDKRLYYDSTLGGVVSMDKLVKVYEDGDSSACSGFAKRFSENI